MVNDGLKAETTTLWLTDSNSTYAASRDAQGRLVDGSWRPVPQRDASDRASITIDNHLTILNQYELKRTPEDFEIAVRSLARLVEAEGHSGVLSYRFSVNASERTARGVINYKSPDSWIVHHDIAMSWPDRAACGGDADGSYLLGPLTSEIQAWIESSSLRECDERLGGGTFRHLGWQPVPRNAIF